MSKPPRILVTDDEASYRAWCVVLRVDLSAVPSAAGAPVPHFRRLCTDQADPERGNGTP
jgi:hypothetical protein